MTADPTDRPAGLGEPDLRRDDLDADYGFEVWSVVCTTCDYQWYGPAWEACSRCVKVLEADIGPLDAYQSAAPAPPAPPRDDDVWPDPVPLGYGGERPAFPVDVFPDWMRDQIEQSAAEMQFAVDLPAMLAITALSIVCAGRAEIRVRGPWREPLNTYLVTALPPGAGKSPAVKSMLGPLSDWEAELAERAAPLVAAHDIDRKALEKERDNLTNKGERSEAKAVQDQLNELVPVVIPRLWVEDATPEALVVGLGEQGGRLGLISTEGGPFDMMTGRYSERANLDAYLQAWSRDTIRVDRIGRPSIIVRSPTLSIGLTVQPTVIQRLADTPELQGRGLTARFMYSIPCDMVGQRDHRRRSTYSDGVASLYGRRLVGLAESLADGEHATIELTEGALDVFLDWIEDHETRMREDGDLSTMREWVTKCQSTTARFAGLLALAHTGDPRVPVSDETMTAAIRVGRYWEGHARLAHDLWGADATTNEALAILGWISRNGVETFTLRDAYGWSRKRFPTAESVVAPLNRLIEYGWIRADFDGPIIVGRRGMAAQTFRSHPDALSRMESHESQLVDGEWSDTTESIQVATHATHASKGDFETSFIHSEPLGERGSEIESHESQPPIPDIDLSTLEF